MIGGCLRRWMVRLLVMMSLIVCLFAVGWWVRSYWKFDVVGRTSVTVRPAATAIPAAQNGGSGAPFVAQTRDIAAQILRGRLTVMYGSHFEDVAKPLTISPRWSFRSWPVGAREPIGMFQGIWGWLGFGNGKLTFGPAWRAQYTTIPFCLIVLPSATLPAVWLRRRLRNRYRDRHGLCLKCGYDLRGSAGRCPECGSADFRQEASDAASVTADKAVERV